MSTAPMYWILTVLPVWLLLLRVLLRPLKRYLYKTDRSGVAKAFFQLGTDAGKQLITAKLVGTDVTDVFTATAIGNQRSASLEKRSGDGQSAAKGKTPDKSVGCLCRKWGWVSTPERDYQI